MIFNKYILNKLENNLFQLSKIIDLKKPKYFKEWDGSFKKYFYGKNKKNKHERPDRPLTKIKFTIKKNNPLKLNKNFEGIYVIINEQLKYFYVGLTKNNIKQRLHSHIQKLTASNINQYDTPKNWQTLSYKRYKLLKDKSVSIDDDKMTIFSINDQKISNIIDIKDIKIFEALIYCNLKKIYKNYEALNGENKLMKTFTKNL